MKNLLLLFFVIIMCGCAGKYCKEIVSTQIAGKYYNADTNQTIEIRNDSLYIMKVSSNSKKVDTLAICKFRNEGHGFISVKSLFNGCHNPFYGMEVNKYNTNQSDSIDVTVYIPNLKRKVLISAYANAGGRVLRKYQKEFANTLKLDKRSEMMNLTIYDSDILKDIDINSHIFNKLAIIDSEFFCGSELGNIDIKNATKVDVYLPNLIDKIFDSYQLSGDLMYIKCDTINWQGNKYIKESKSDFIISTITGIPE